jgi:hypothetical protein
VGPQDPKDVARDTARDLSGLVGELAALKGDANHWLTDPEYAALRHRLEATHAAAEAALVEARRRVRLNERQGELTHPRARLSDAPYFPVGRRARRVGGGYSARAASIASDGRGGAGKGRAPPRFARGSGGHTEAVEEESIRRIGEECRTIRPHRTRRGY